MERLAIPPKLETQRLILQRLRVEDAEEIFYTYASKEEATRYVSWPTHQSIKDTRAYVRYAVQAWDMGVEFSFSIRLKDSQKMIGSIGMVNDQGKIQLGYILTPTCWNKGYATEACMRLIHLLRNTKWIHRIGSFVDYENIASINVLKKCGLVEEAQLEKWFRFVNQDNRPKNCILFKLEL